MGLDAADPDQKSKPRARKNDKLAKAAAALGRANIDGLAPNHLFPYWLRGDWPSASLKFIQNVSRDKPRPRCIHLPVAIFWL
jgi:hypothetical protein